MLDLYHSEPTLDSGEPLICLEEKALAFESRYLDLLRLEQHEPQFLRLNPSGQVPVLVHDGRVFTEAGLALLYLDEAFPSTPLMPAPPAEQYQVHFWLKLVEERMAPYVSLLGWRVLVRPALGQAQVERARRSIERLPAERRGVWERALDDVSPEEVLALARESLGAAARRLEQALERGPWLAGGSYSLADIALVLTVRALRVVLPETVNAERTPRTLEWLERVGDRPAVRRALARARTLAPERYFVPGPELPRWG
ncbi:MAG: glutathione S-transferase family protein [Steroidobacteraceae bacterium]